MSILWTLRKYVDAIQHREEDAGRRRARQVPQQRIAGDGGAPPEGQVPVDVTPRVCRVCGLRAKGETFCPQCLAQTMVDEPPPAE